MWAHRPLVRRYRVIRSFQLDHAAALAKEQLDTAQAAARAAKMASWAAAAAAAGAIAQAIIAIVK
jgi:hypothetical protein